jgi:hypothetical protein
LIDLLPPEISIRAVVSCFYASVRPHPASLAAGHGTIRPKFVPEEE